MNCYINFLIVPEEDWFGQSKYSTVYFHLF